MYLNRFENVYVKTSVMAVSSRCYIHIVLQSVSRIYSCISICHRCTPSHPSTPQPGCPFHSRVLQLLSSSVSIGTRLTWTSLQFTTCLRCQRSVPVWEFVCRLGNAAKACVGVGGWADPENAWNSGAATFRLPSFKGFLVS